MSTIIWKNLKHTGHEICKIETRKSVNILTGTAIFHIQNKACKLDYEVVNDYNWVTRKTRINGYFGAKELDFNIINQDSGWKVNEEELPITGATFIDLGFSPSTNLIPIRKLWDETLQKAEISVLWLKFPELTFQPLDQTYTLHSSSDVHYASGGGAFETALKINEQGFVTEYPNLWKAIHFSEV